MKEKFYEVVFICSLTKYYDFYLDLTKLNSDVLKLL